MIHKRQKGFTQHHFYGRKSGAGFIALMSAIIISAILLIITVSLSYSSFFARYAILESEYKERSSALAEGNVDAALLKLASDPNYTGTETVIIGGASYTYRVMDSGSYKIIETQGKFPDNINSAYTALRVSVDAGTLAVISWVEVPHF